MLENRNLNENLNVSVDNIRTADSKTPPGCAKHWRHPNKRSNKSNVASVSASAVPAADRRQSPPSSLESPPISKSKFWRKKGHRTKKDTAHTAVADQEPPHHQTSDARTATNAGCDETDVHTEEARNDRTNSAPTVETNSAMDTTIYRRDSPASPECISILSHYEDTELDFEFGLDDTLLVFPTQATMNQCSADAAHTNVNSDPPVNTSSVVATVDHLAQVLQNHLDIANDTTITTTDSSFIVTTNAAGAAILDSIQLASKNKQGIAQGEVLSIPTWVHSNTNNSPFLQAPPPPPPLLDMNFYSNQAGTETRIYPTAPSFLPMPSSPAAFWSSPAAVDPMFITPQQPHSYPPLQYGPIPPTGYGPSFMPAPLQSSPFYLDAAGANHPSNPVPFFSPPSPPVQYQQVMVGGTVFYSPVYSLEPMTEAVVSSLSPQSPVDRAPSFSGMGNGSKTGLTSIHGASLGNSKNKKKKNTKKRLMRKEEVPPHI